MAKSSTHRVTIYINGKEAEASVNVQNFRTFAPSKTVMPTIPTYSSVSPLKGLRKTRAASVSYRASSPDGDGALPVYMGSRFVPTTNSSLLTANSSYTFSAKEKDSETGLSYFGSRYYSSDLSIWLSVDPMSDKYPSLSPYVYCADNPVKLVDPNGEEINPIYDRFGYFLGTDDRGLQGDLIVMDRKNFQQNMSHDDALNNSTYFDMHHYSEAEARCLDHFNSLKDRPDYDGFVTISEGIQWAKNHPNAKFHPTPDNTLYIDAAQLDLGFLTVKNSGLNVGDDYVNINLYDFVDRKNPRSVNTTYALGNTGIKLLDNKGTISFSGDVYDWDYHTKSPMRNSLIFFERLRRGLDDSHGFKICIYGTAKLNQTWPF
jgi:RHS repeat-associated protein